jgi:ribosomal protein S18 acetylase RimI-like enzyme
VSGEAERVAIAYRNHQRIGWLRIGFLYQSHPQVVYAMGTWTHPRYRRRGIATRVWQYMIHCLQPSRVEVGTVSEAGYRLVRSLRAQYPDIQWMHDDCRF